MGPESNHIEAAIADLEGWKDRIDTAIETLKMFRAGGGALPGVAPSMAGTSRAPAASGEIHHDTFFQMSVPDAAEKCLTMAKKTMPTADIATALLKGGLKSAAKNFPSMLNTILTRESRFVRVNREWGLGTWYPGMRKATGRKQQASETHQAVSDTKPETPKQESRASGSVKDRAFVLINSEPTIAFDAPTVAARLKSGNVRSVRVALSNLFADGSVARPAKGKYQAK